MSEAWHIMHGRDVSGEEAREAKTSGHGEVTAHSRLHSQVRTLPASLQTSSSQIPQKVDVTRQWDPH